MYHCISTSSTAASDCAGRSYQYSAYEADVSTNLIPIMVTGVFAVGAGNTTFYWRAGKLGSSYASPGVARYSMALIFIPS
jgi:hypothetical protein